MPILLAWCSCAFSVASPLLEDADHFELINRILNLFAARNYNSGHEACRSIILGRTVNVREEAELAAALQEPSVSCILIAVRNLTLSHDFWGPEVHRHLPRFNTPVAKAFAPAWWLEKASKRFCVG